MPAKKSPATQKNPDNPGNPIQVLKEATCPTSTGKSTLGYQIGVDSSGEIHFQVTSNDGGGFFSIEWVALSDIQAAIEAWPEGQPLTSMTFRKLFRGKSANNPGFLTAVLLGEGLLEPVSEKKRVHQACDPAPFLAHVEELRGNTAGTSAGKPVQKAKAKSSTRRTTARKSPARAKKT